MLLEGQQKVVTAKNVCKTQEHCHCTNGVS